MDTLIWPQVQATLPKGDPRSPIIFKLVIDWYNKIMNMNISWGVATLFVDEVLLWHGVKLTCKEFCAAPSRVLRTSQWYRQSINPVRYGCQSSQSLGERRYQTKTKIPTSECRSDRVNDGKLVARLKIALTALWWLWKRSENWRLTVKQRRVFVKTFVKSICDFLPYLQPMKL